MLFSQLVKSMLVTHMMVNALGCSVQYMYVVFAAGPLALLLSCVVCGARAFVGNSLWSTEVFETLTCGNCSHLRSARDTHT